MPRFASHGVTGYAIDYCCLISLLIRYFDTDAADAAVAG